MSTKYDYFKPEETENYRFLMLPKILLESEKYAHITIEAKVLYAYMTERVGLSCANNWVDKDNHVYIIFTTAEISETIHCSKDKTAKMLNELENAGLIERQRQKSMGKPNIIYVKNFMREINTEIEKKTDNVCFSESICQKNRPKITENQTKDVSKTDTININTTDNNFIKTDLILHQTAMHKKTSQTDEEITETINQSIDYEILCHTYDRDLVTTIRDIIVDVINGQISVKANGKQIASDKAAKLFLNLKHKNISDVIEKMAAQQIISPINWLPTALYNSAISESSCKKRICSESSFDLDLIMEHAKNTPLVYRMKT